MSKKLISGVCIIALLISVMTAVPVFAAGSVADYNSAKALKYAKSHWNDGVGDCVKFVRACVEAGGVPKESGRTYGYTVKQYRNYLVKNNFAVVNKLNTDYYYSDYQGIRMSENKGKIAPGDIILYHCNNKNCSKPDFHMSIANGANGTNEGKYIGFVTCYAANKDINNKVACKIKCSKCGADKNSITLYAIHFKSKENGYYTSKVTGLKALATSYDTLTIKWNKLSSADGYKLYRSETKSGTYTELLNTEKTSVKDIVHQVGKVYYYKVQPYCNINGKTVLGNYSAVVSANTKPDAPVINAVKAGKTSVTVSWNKIDGAEGYRIYRATSKKGEYSSVKTINDGEIFSFTNSKLKKNTTYYYKVKAYMNYASKNIYSNYSKYKYVKL